jgi:drug/metabolite transporter (DMT)-like permease
MLSVIFGLLSAITWGAGDFSGGLASRRTSAYQVVAINWTAGLLILPVIAVFSGEPLLPLSNWLWCAAAGGFGVVGILIMYQALADGTMSLVASVAAVTAAAFPVVVGSFVDGLPGIATISGFILALVGVWLISQTQSGQKKAQVRLRELKFPLLAGVGFGFYYILMPLGSQDKVFWPMVASHTAGVLVMLVFMTLRRRSWLPTRGSYLLIGLNLVLDNAGTFFYILAARAGRMDIAAVLSSLYPGMTILLAWMVLREKINWVQWAGIGFALAAIVLFSV